MALRNPSKLKPAFAYLGEKNGGIVVDEYGSQKSKDRPWIAVMPLEPGPALSLFPTIVRVRAKLPTKAEDWEMLARGAAPSFVGMGNMSDDDGDVINFPQDLDGRARLLRLNPDLLLAVYQTAQAAMEAVSRTHQRREADRGNSETSSAGKPEEAPASSSPGSNSTRAN